MTRSPSASDRGIGIWRNCIASAATFSSRAIRRTPLPAEEAFLTAIAVAQQQKARSFELRAALALAKLYQSTNRAADAHAVLAPALEGFSSTPEFPEIEEAQALLEVLERDEAIKAVLARRERRVQLQLAYGAALISARGYGAEETVKAFDRARELSAGVGGSVDRLALLHGMWLGAVTTESFEAASKASAALLAEATQARNGGVKASRTAPSARPCSTADFSTRPSVNSIRRRRCLRSRTMPSSRGASTAARGRRRTF